MGKENVKREEGMAWQGWGGVISGEISEAK